MSGGVHGTGRGRTGMNESTSQRKNISRLFDFLAIVIVALVLLGLAWQVGKVISQTPESRSDVSTAIEDFVDTPELQLCLPLERLGMEMSREMIPGGRDIAVAHLEGQCRDVLDVADQWVLSLAVTEEEHAALKSITEATPLDRRTGLRGWRSAMLSTTSPTGRACVRETMAQPGDTASPERRLLCWGFILGEGTDAQTVWFARPREKLSEVAARSATPASIKSRIGDAP